MAKKRLVEMHNWPKFQSNKQAVRLKRKANVNLKLEANLNKSILVINIESLNINMTSCIFHKPNGYNSNNLIYKMANNQRHNCGAYYSRTSNTTKHYLRIIWDPISTMLGAISHLLCLHHIIYDIVVHNIFSTKNHTEVWRNSKIEN